MKKLEGGLSNVRGYSFSAIECGIRYADRLDYCLIGSDRPCNAAGVFTTNKLTAAPVRLSRERIAGPVHAILVNATNANACTGEQGLDNTIKLTADIARHMNIPADSILMGSTGIIGRQLPVEKMLASHERLVKGLSPAKGEMIARAIMTTDTVPKEYAVSFPTERGDFTIAGVAKGSGMIAPNMATLLSFIITDAPVRRDDLDRLFRKSITRTLNAITIDGDMSTNDTAILLSPADENPLVSPDDLASFENALHAVLLALAEMLVKDGEGATKSVWIRVRHAASEADAWKAARSIGQSLLVKTALFGQDPNWGRIGCAAGYSGAALDEQKLCISFENMMVLKNGVPQEFKRDDLVGIMSKAEFSVTVDLGLGNSQADMLTCDVSYDYVKINAEYST